MRSMTTAALTAIGVPCSAGAHHGGLERAPAALRAAGLLDRLRQAGWEVADAGGLTEVNPTHDPAGDLLGRYLDGVAAALTRPALGG